MKSSKRRETEHDIQCAVVKWARMRSWMVPSMSLLFSIPNGGLRDPVTACHLVQEGVLPGVPDLCLAIGNNGYHALYIEMKSERGRLTDEQKVIHQLLRAANNRVEVCRSWIEAAQCIEEYLGCERTV